MLHEEQRPAEPAHRDGPAAPVDLVLIGHVGSATDRTPHGTATYTGGSGFAVAFAASALLDCGVGLVTQVGEDFDLASLRRLPIDMQGVTVRPGASAAFVIDHFRDGSRSFRSDLGVAAEPAGRRSGPDRSRGNPGRSVPRAACPRAGGGPRAALRGRGGDPVGHRVRGNRPGRDPRAQPRPGRTGR